MASAVYATDFDQREMTVHAQAGRQRGSERPKIWPVWLKFASSTPHTAGPIGFCFGLSDCHWSSQKIGMKTVKFKTICHESGQCCDLKPPIFYHRIWSDILKNADRSLKIITSAGKLLLNGFKMSAKPPEENDWRCEAIGRIDQSINQSICLCTNGPSRRTNASHILKRTPYS